jgi:hypothetical protein
MNEKYLSKLILGLLFVSGVTYVIGLTSTKSEFWTIVTSVSFAIATYLLFKLTKCRFFLVLLSFDLLYFGNELLNDYGLEVGNAWRNIISFVKWILIILMVTVYLKERKILFKKLKDIFTKKTLTVHEYYYNHDIQLNKLTKPEILLIIFTILLTIIVIVGFAEYANFRVTRKLRPIPLIILGILLFIWIIIGNIINNLFGDKKRNKTN